MRIRLAVRDDLAVVMELLRRVVSLLLAVGNRQWDESYPDEAVFARDIEREELWVAEIDGAIAGVIAATTDQEPEYALLEWDMEETVVVLHRLAVDPEFRGAEVAVALMRKAEAVAAERGIRVLRVDTGAENEVMQRLLLKLGYEFAGEIGLSFRPGMRFLCYEKRLS
jgi:ribosomal protein S18 acetylase RimI-like enzyme